VIGELRIGSRNQGRLTIMLSAFFFLDVEQGRAWGGLGWCLMGVGCGFLLFRSHNFLETTI